MSRVEEVKEERDIKTKIKRRGMLGMMEERSKEVK